jgi:hypothetical protein
MVVVRKALAGRPVRLQPQWFGRGWLGCWLMLALLGVAGAGHAAEYMSQRQITSLGCHSGDGTCFVTLDGALFGKNEPCAANYPTGINQFRFDNGDTPSGRRAYASLMAAFLAGKRVDIAISGCTGQGVPALSYYIVY